MKIRLYCMTFLSFILNFDQVCRASSMQTNPDDDFIGVIEKSTGIKLGHQEFTPELAGYKIPLFEGQQINRNHFDERPESTPIKYLVMHYTVCNTPITLRAFTRDIDDGRVSSHYVITETELDLKIPGGKIIQICPDEKRSWHAGISKWKETKNLNAFSIGIENVNKGFTVNDSSEKTWYGFDKDQMSALGNLSQNIIKQYIAKLL